MNGEQTDIAEARGLSYMSDVIDIYSNSWGPPDLGFTVDPPGPLAEMVFETEAEKASITHQFHTPFITTMILVKFCILTLHLILFSLIHLNLAFITMFSLAVILIQTNREEVEKVLYMSGQLGMEGT